MAIQQHPIPQDISNYRFRLIGDMTIKQFVSLGIFILLSVIIYGSPIPFFFRYPLSFIFLITGITMAFVPIQGRSLDVWIVAFIKSIYSPTQYVWKSSPEPTVATPSPSEEKNNPVTPVVPISTPMSSTNDTNTTPQTPEAPITPPAKTSTPEPLNPETPVSQDNVSIPIDEPVKIDPPTQTTPPPDEPKPKAPPTVSLPIPFTPTTPNTIVGLSLTTDNHILDGVMVEIKKDNFTIRATRSNKLGQFLFARPLENGIYQILAEKEGYSFTPYAIELTGEIIRPLKIQAI